MPRRELLAAAEREELLAFLAEESELIRRYTLTRADRTFIRQHRGHHNRLGIAIQLCYLRHPCRVPRVHIRRTRSGTYSARYIKPNCKTDVNATLKRQRQNLPSVRFYFAHSIPLSLIDPKATAVIGSSRGVTARGRFRGRSRITHSSDDTPIFRSQFRSADSTAAAPPCRRSPAYCPRNG